MQGGGMDEVTGGKADGVVTSVPDGASSRNSDLELQVLHRLIDQSNGQDT
jgi:hypothetical protein